MKRIFLAAIAAAALLAGCAKSEDAPEARKLNVVFSVADKDSYGADTKAVKQGWSVNDEILIVFESEMNDWLNPSVNDNTVLLVYDGEGWYVANQDENLIKNLRTSSSWFYAVHYPGGSIMLGTQDGEGKTKFQTYKGGEYLTADGEWRLEGNNLILGEINMKRRPDMFQISVQDLADQAGNWTLSILNDVETAQDMQITHMNKYVGLYVKEDKVGMAAPQQQEATGIKIGDDVAFTFIMDGDHENVDYFTYVLSNGTDTYKMQLTTQKDGQPVLQGGKAYLMPGSYSTKWTQE
jgi:hypothetical protein